MAISPDGILPNISRKNPERDFELVKQIGSGTYGEVYKAKLVKTGQLCALKIIKIEPGEDFNIIQQEILILSECKHANIVGYLGSYLRALYLMTKRNFRPPTLQHKNKWSNNFHDFLSQALKKDPKIRPNADDLLKHEFVHRDLSGLLMVPLIRVLEAPSPKPKMSASDPDEEDDTGARKESQMKRISSVKHHNKIDRQISDVAMHGLNLPPKQEAQEPISAWLDEPFHKPRIQRLSAEAITQYDMTDPEYQSVDSIYQSPEDSLTPPPADRTPVAPPVPPRGTSSSRISRVPIPLPDDNNSPHVYGNVGPSNPPVPPRNRPPQETVTPTNPTPPAVPPRPSSKPSIHKKQSTEGRAYFSKIFNGCPLKLHCATSWTHPHNQNYYVLLGAEEGLFSLQANTQQDPVMEQVSPRSCHWLRVVENVLIWLSGTNHMISMTNLIQLFQSESQKAPGHRNRSHTSKIHDSKGCYKCSIARNPFSDQRYLLAAVPKGILVMQWYQPRHAFMHVKLFECSLPSPLNMFEAFVIENDEYPSVCVGVRESEGGNVQFNAININSNSCWFDSFSNDEIIELQQLEKDTIFVASQFCAKFVDLNGTMKPSGKQASQIYFDKKTESMVYLQNCVLSFHKHGMQGKSLITQQVTAEVADSSKVFHLLGSHGTIIIETKQADDASGPSNLYILVSEEAYHVHSQ
uniref:non-specific serine/threonine protein kinase n=1 Tax=Amphimedon queenslandica TaxID=400682 RepID=A0A1X7UZT5_AMPQE